MPDRHSGLPVENGDARRPLRASHHAAAQRASRSRPWTSSPAATEEAEDRSEHAPPNGPRLSPPQEPDASPSSREMAPGRSCRSEQGGVSRRAPASGAPPDPAPEAGRPCAAAGATSHTAMPLSSSGSSLDIPLPRTQGALRRDEHPLSLERISASMRVTNGIEVHPARAGRRRLSGRQGSRCLRPPRKSPRRGQRAPPRCRPSSALG